MTRPQCSRIRFGPRGADSQNHDILSRRRDLNPLLQHCAISFLIGDYVVGRKQSNHGIGIAVRQDECSEPDGWRRVAPHRFGQNAFRAKLRELPHDLSPQMLIGDHPEARRRGQGQQPSHGLLDHGLLSVERQQLLGATLPAQRPEARAPAAGENHRMEVCLSHE